MTIQKIAALVRDLHQQAAMLALLGEKADLVVSHFQPRFTACWTGSELTDHKTADLLGPFIISHQREAERYRRQEHEIRHAIVTLLELKQKRLA